MESKYRNSNYLSKMFPRVVENGLKHSEILELFGPTGSGKTEMLYKICVEALLPVELTGHGKGVVVVDLDGKFDVNRVALLLRVHARHPLTQCDAVDGKADPTSVGVNGARAALIAQSTAVQFTSPKLAYRLGARLHVEDAARAPSSGSGSGSGQGAVASNPAKKRRKLVEPASFDERLERLVEACLTHLWIVRCNTPAEFVATLKCGLPTLCATELERGQAPIDYVLIDGLNSFFYILKDFAAVMLADVVRYVKELALDRNKCVVVTTLEIFKRDEFQLYTVYPSNVMSSSDFARAVHTRLLLGRAPGSPTDVHQVLQRMHSSTAGAVAAEFVLHQDHGGKLVYPFSIDPSTGVTFHRPPYPMESTVLPSPTAAKTKIKITSI